MKIIFLDFDGVLVNRESLRLPRTPLTGKDYRTATACPSCIEALNYIVQATGARIVVSSVWRGLGVKALRELFMRWKANASIVGRTPEFRDRPRGEEIQAWLTAHSGIDSFVIIDDDADMGHLSPHLIQTEFELGLTMADAQRAVDLLNKRGEIAA